MILKICGILFILQIACIAIPILTLLFMNAVERVINYVEKDD